MKEVRQQCCSFIAKHASSPRCRKNYSLRSNYPVPEFLKVKSYSIVITKLFKHFFEVLLIDNSKNLIPRKLEDFFASREFSLAENATLV